MASRPPKVTGEPNYENPQSIDRIVKALGATGMDWAYKTECCGASLMVSRPGVGVRMAAKILDMAKRLGAQAIVVSCQMCQLNLDMYQERIEAETGKVFGLPVVYFTELIGIAAGFRAHWTRCPGILSIRFLRFANIWAERNTSPRADKAYLGQALIRAGRNDANHKKVEQMRQGQK